MDDLDAKAYELLLEPPSPKGGRPSAKMRPNTRFLQHIVREAKSHNAALLAKETADSQARLKRLMQTDKRRGRGGPDVDDETPDDADTKRGRSDKDKSENRKRKRGSESTKDDDDSQRRLKRRSRIGDKDVDKADDDRDDDRRRRHQRHRSSRKDDDERKRSHRSRSRSRSRSPGGKRHRSSKHRRRSESSPRSQSSRRHQEQSRSPSHKSRDDGRRREHSTRDDKVEKKNKKEQHNDEDETSTRSTSQHHKKEGAHRDSEAKGQPRKKQAGRKRSRKSESTENSSDSDSSDPLDAFVGPRLASESGEPATSRMRVRGRGATSAQVDGDAGASSIDRHFAADYDPSEDVEEKGWSQPQTKTGKAASSTTEDARAEMQRDRQQLLRDGAERLRAAGFTDKEIAIWARGGRRPMASADDAWSKAGEQREWDRGKVAGEDGPAKPLWARSG